MKFTTAWADTISQNQLLKILIGVLSVVAVVLSICASTLGMREPIVINRSCFTTAAVPASVKHTPQEIEGFLREVISYRFDSEIEPKVGFLSLDEESFRRKEQLDLSQKKISQKVVMRSLKIEGDVISVDADRLLAVGDIRSAFQFPLIVTLATIARSESNPYGLLLKRVSSKAPDKEAK